MGGIELRDDVLAVDREPNELDALAIEFSKLLSGLGVDHAYVAGYVAILAGRSRATEDIDVLLEPCDRATVETLVERLRDRGFWGPAMPLDDAHEMLSNGDLVWVARDGEVVPHLEVKYVGDEFDRASVENAITAHVGGAELPIGPLELGIAYKLYLGTRTDFEDAAHLYAMFGESLSRGALERWVEKLDVTEEYERLEPT